jgi:hypothetical protein
MAPLALLLRVLLDECRERDLKWYAAAIDAPMFGPTTANRSHREAIEMAILRPVNLPWACDGELRALLRIGPQGKLLRPLREGAGW